MTNIDQLSAILQVIRRRVDEKRAPSTGSTLSGRGSGHARVGTRPAPEGLREELRGKLKKLDHARPEHAETARRLFLESILSWEFGPTVMADPGFNTIVQKVYDAIATDAELSGRFDRMLKELQS